MALFRFVSFSLGAGLVFVLNTDEPSISRVFILVVVGVYNIVRVVRPFNPLEFHAPVRWFAAASDVALSLTLVLSTDGFESAFLIFSLAPLLTVSLLMDLRSGIFFAGVAALSITGAYVAGGLGIGDYPSLLDGNYLVFALLYGAVCLLVTLLPFLANLNWERRLRAESVGSERRRLRREVHDNIAQTLAFLSLKVKRAEDRAADAGVAISGRDVSEVARAVERAYLAVRDYLDGSEDVVAEPGPFGEVLASTIAQWSRECGLRAETTVHRRGRRAFAQGPATAGADRQGSPGQRGQACLSKPRPGELGEHADPSVPAHQGRRPWLCRLQVAGARDEYHGGAGRDDRGLGDRRERAW